MQGFRDRDRSWALAGVQPCRPDMERVPVIGCGGALPSTTGPDGNPSVPVAQVEPRVQQNSGYQGRIDPITEERLD